jgi:hypothetical protein
MNEPVVRIRIELEGTDPQVWRSVDVPLSSTLTALHDIIQVTMRWQGAHMFEFVVGDQVYGEPYPDDSAWDRKVLQAKSIRLKTLVERGVDRFLYVYDFGDNWRHHIILDSVRQGEDHTDYPAFVGGARRAPPDDVGGISGFEAFLEAVIDPRHEDHDQMLKWSDGSFDPEDIDERDIRMIIGNFAARRRGPLLSHRGSGRTREQ